MNATASIINLLSVVLHVVLSISVVAVIMDIIVRWRRKQCSGRNNGIEAFGKK